jgi:hypothetical protein
VQHPIYIEIWDRDDYHEYFTTHPRIMMNPLTFKDHPLRGWHNFTGERHEICLIHQPEIFYAIIHEMMHCKQAEVVGVTLYEQLADIYDGDRLNDPFEIQAYLEEKRYKEGYYRV